MLYIYMYLYLCMEFFMFRNMIVMVKGRLGRFYRPKTSQSGDLCGCHWSERDSREITGESWLSPETTFRSFDSAYRARLIKWRVSIWTEFFASTLSPLLNNHLLWVKPHHKHARGVIQTCLYVGSLCWKFQRNCMQLQLASREFQIYIECTPVTGIRIIASLQSFELFHVKLLAIV